MTYRELLEKDVFLCGTKKRCGDVREFFCELSIAQELCFATIEEMTGEEGLEQIQAYLDKKSEKDIFIITEEYMEKLFKRLKKRNMTLGKDYLWIDDLLAVTDEMETFYIDKMRNDKKIAVYGTGDILKDMIEKNPSLRMDYVVAMEERGENTDGFAIEGYPQISPAHMPQEERENLFIILAVEVHPKVKQLFLDAGFAFGKGFHFYNPRVPKHPTAYYLKKTFYDKPRYILPCDYATRALSLKNRGAVMACCSSVTLALGNFKYTGIEEVLAGIQAQIINLSINNRTYSFCSNLCFMFRENAYRLEEDGLIEKNERRYGALHTIPDFNVQLGYDRSCNLACPSCRTHRITEPEEKTEIVEMLHAEVKNMCMKNPQNIRIGNGEVFFSKYYRDIVFHCYESKSIALITNGILFHQENWEKLEGRYQKIFLEVSMDAVKKETYQKLRGG